MTNKDELLETVAKALHASDPLARGYRGDWQSYKPIAQVAIDTIRAAARPAQEPDDDHPDCSTAREVELYDALMLLAGLMLNKQQQLYRNGMQGSIRVAPVVSKALRLPLTGDDGK